MNNKAIANHLKSAIMERKEESPVRIKAKNAPREEENDSITVLLSDFDEEEEED